MYKPEGWENPHLYFGSPHTEFDVQANERHEAYEAGADAMLEGLKKDIIPSHRGTDGWHFLATKDAILYNAFIPKEEDVKR